MLQIGEIRTVAVIGAGLMGSGFAQTFAQAGYAVRLHARREDTLRAARDRITRDQEAMLRAGLLAERAARDALARIQTTTSLQEATRGGGSGHHGRPGAALCGRGAPPAHGPGGSRHDYPPGSAEQAVAAGTPGSSRCCGCGRNGRSSEAQQAAESGWAATYRRSKPPTHLRWVPAPGTHRGDGCAALHLDLFEQPKRKAVLQHPASSRGPSIRRNVR
jgi:hypothetical protein